MHAGKRRDFQPLWKIQTLNSSLVNVICACSGYYIITKLANDVCTQCNVPMMRSLRPPSNKQDDLNKHCVYGLNVPYNRR